MNAWLERRRGPVGWALFALTLGLLVATLDAPGITWDEPSYYTSAQLQVRWAEKLLREGPAAAIDREVIREMWDWDHYHNPHPPIYKEGMALTWWAARGLLGPLAAYRLFPALLFAALVALQFRWGTAAWSGTAGLGAALVTLGMPRLFGHAHIGATETPLLVFWTLAATAGWWAIERRRRAGWIVAGIAWGLAAGAKFTGLAALAPVVLWGLWRDPRRTVAGAGIAAACAVAVFAALNPLVWVDPVGFARTWLWESLHRADYAPITTYYLGRRYGFDIPWHHVFVMTAAVTPLGILAMVGLGTVEGARRRDGLVVLALASVAFFWGIMLLPQAAHHNGVRQFVPLFPFLALLAGYGLHRTAERLTTGWLALVGALVFLPPAFQTAAIHPYYLSYYGEAVGGLRGARELGFETTYWMDVVSGEPLEWMNRELPHGATVLVLGEPRALEFAQAFGKVRADLRFTGLPPADYYLVPMSQFVIGPNLERAMEEVDPVYRLERRGVLLLAVFRMEPEVAPAGTDR